MSPKPEYSAMTQSPLGSLREGLLSKCRTEQPSRCFGFTHSGLDERFKTENRLAHCVVTVILFRLAIATCSHWTADRTLVVSRTLKDCDTIVFGIAAIASEQHRTHRTTLLNFCCSPVVAKSTAACVRTTHPGIQASIRHSSAPYCRILSCTVMWSIQLIEQRQKPQASHAIAQAELLKFQDSTLNPESSVKRVLGSNDDIPCMESQGLLFVTLTDDATKVTAIPLIGVSY